MKLSIPQLIKLRLGGHVYVGHRQRNGWRAPLPHYAFKCPVHGPVESYPHGYEQRLECPQCKAEVPRPRPGATA